MAVDGGEAASGAGAAGPPSLETSALLSRLGDVSLWDLEVTAVEAVSPSMRRIRCTAPGLGQLSYQPGQDLMLAVPGPGNRVLPPPLPHRVIGPARRIRRHRRRAPRRWPRRGLGRIVPTGPTDRG